MTNTDYAAYLRTRAGAIYRAYCRGRLSQDPSASADTSTEELCAHMLGSHEVDEPEVQSFDVVLGRVAELLLPAAPASTGSYDAPAPHNSAEPAAAPPSPAAEPSTVTRSRDWRRDLVAAVLTADQSGELPLDLRIDAQGAADTSAPRPRLRIRAECVEAEPEAAKPESSYSPALEAVAKEFGYTAGDLLGQAVQEWVTRRREQAAAPPRADGAGEVQVRVGAQAAKPAPIAPTLWEVIWSEEEDGRIRPRSFGAVASSAVRWVDGKPAQVHTAYSGWIDLAGQVGRKFVYAPDEAKADPEAAFLSIPDLRERAQ